MLLVRAAKMYQDNRYYIWRMAPKLAKLFKNVMNLQWIASIPPTQNRLFVERSFMGCVHETVYRTVVECLCPHKHKPRKSQMEAPYGAYWDYSAYRDIPGHTVHTGAYQGIRCILAHTGLTVHTGAYWVYPACWGLLVHAGAYLHILCCRGV
jgi:hypothetical protein